jgi:hypothetical protein
LRLGPPRGALRRPPRHPRPLPPGGSGAARAAGRPGCARGATARPPGAPTPPASGRRARWPGCASGPGRGVIASA